MVPVILNLAIVLMEAVSFLYMFPREKTSLLVFYTILSNLCACVASLAFLILGRASMVTVILRYNATCMLVLTCIVANLVLIPMGVGVRGILWKDCGLIHHLIAPILSLVSYELYEEHIPAAGILIPIGVTVVYAAVILILVYKNRIKPPYPFLEIRKQSIGVSVLWACLILGAVALIGYVV